MVDEKLLKEIEDYCKLNDLDFSIEVNKMLKSAFTTFKYGSSPKILKKKEKPVEPVKTVEKVIEKVIEEVKVEVKKEMPIKKANKLDMYGE